jgi:flagellar hook-associated protein 3 FlgL
MRVTEGSIVFNFLADVNRSRERIVQLHSQLASTKRVLKPSDDPQATELILRLKNAIDRNEQFERNVADGQSMMEGTGSALDAFSNVMLELKDIVTRASNPSLGNGLGALADRVDQLLAEAVDIANTKLNGKYLFGGTQTLDPPFTLAADHSAVTANPNGITGSVAYPVGEGSTQVVNIDGQEAFQGTQIFDLMIQLRNSMRSGAPPSAAQGNGVSTMLEYVAGKAGKAGSLQQNLDALRVQLADQRVLLQELLSLHQDTDVAEATMQLKHYEIMLDAALNTGAQVIPKSLLDFLR